MSAFRCWHCGTTDPAKPGVCSCAFCGKDSAIGFISGLCGFCVNRDKDQEIYAKMDHYGLDIRDSRHWRLVRHTTGGCHRVLNPIFPGEEPYG